MDDNETSKLDTEPSSDTVVAPGLGRQMAKGAAWMVFMQVAIRIIGLISMVILARLLVPADFGLIALAMMVYGLLEVFGQFGFDVVLIQNQQAGRQHYDTAWTLTVIRNTVIAAILVAGAPLAASFFDEPRIEAIFYWLALAAFVEGFANIGVVNFRKDLEFHKDFVFMVGTKLGTFAVAVPLAFAWQNYWALVAGIVAGAFIRVVLGYYMNAYRPRLSLSRLSEIVNFSAWLVSSNILRYIQNRSDIFLVGKLVGPAGLGIYSVAYEISNLATTELISPIRRALLPGYSRIADEEIKVRRSFLDGTALIVAVGVPIAAGVGLTAEIFIPLLLGKNWLDAIPIVQILAISGFLQVGTATTSPILIATGKPHLVTYGLACSVIVGIPVMIWGGMNWGIVGVTWGVVWASTVLAGLFLTFGARAVGVNGKQIIAAIWRSLASVTAMAVVVSVVITTLPETQSLYPLFGKFIIAILSGCISYTLCHLALWRISDTPDGPESYLLDVINGGLNRRLRTPASHQ